MTDYLGGDLLIDLKRLSGLLITINKVNNMKI